MDDDWTTDTIAILDEVVGVIPRRTILSCLPRVGAGLTWGKSALCHTRNTVVGIGAQLTDTVPMDGSTVVTHVVGNINDNVVTPVALNCWSWNLTVYGQAHAVGTVEVASGVGQDQAIVAGLSSVGPGSRVVAVDIESTAPRLSVSRAVAGRGGCAICWAGHVASSARGVCGWRLSCCAADGGRGDNIAVGTGGANSADD